jgi:hypothetical protein
MKKREKLLALCGIAPVSMLIGSAAQAASPVLSLSTTTLAGNTAGQTIQLFIDGTDTNVTAADLAVQVGDGGTVNDGTATGPIITGVSFAGGMLNGASDLPQYDPKSATSGLDLADAPFLSGPDVSDNNAGSRILFATLTFSTVGFTGTSSTLTFEDVDPNGRFDGAHTDVVLDLGNDNVSSVLTTGPGPNGSSTVAISITAVPEPASLGLGAMCLSGLMLRRRGKVAGDVLDNR